jgi:hypothetical protein
MSTFKQLEYNFLKCAAVPLWWLPNTTEERKIYFLPIKGEAITEGQYETGGSLFRTKRFHK